MNVTYTSELDLTADQFIDVLHRSGLAERRPISDLARVDSMLRNADVTICARDTEDCLIGVARCITDFAYCCYCSDLAVDRAWQGRGIGREFMRRSHEAAGLATTFLLLSAPQAMSFYDHAGLANFDNCFGIRRES